MNYFETTKILAPYDFSACSQSAVETAMKIAGKNENITVLHVVDLPSHGRTGLKRLLIGSTAERVVRLAQ